MNNPVLKLIREMNLSIFNENELVDKDIVVLFPGKFNPMGIHQKEEYDRLCRKFGKENVYVITDDKVDIQRLPLSYDEKYAIMKRHGVKNIIKSNTPYHATDVMEKFDGQDTVVIYALGKDDLSKIRDFKRLTKYNNSSNLPYKDIQNPYVYYIISNHVSYDIPSFGEMTRETIHKALSDREAKLSELKSRFISIFGWFDVKLFNMVIGKFNEKRGKMIEVKKKKEGELRPLHMITRKFWDKVYESVITEEVEQINEVATLPTGLLKEIEPVAIELFTEIADLIRLDSSFNAFKRVLIPKVNYGFEHQEYITAVVNRWIKNEDYVKKYGNKFFNGIKLRSVDFEVAGGFDNKFSEITKVLQYCFKNNKNEENAGIALEIEHLLNPDFDSEYELNNKINYTKFNSEFTQFSTNSDEFSGGAALGSSTNFLDKATFRIYFTFEFIPFFVKIQLAKRGTIETSVDTIIQEFVKKVFLPTIAHELIHYVQRVKEFSNSQTLHRAAYNRLQQDDPNFWKTYLSDTMEIGAHAQEFVEQMRSNFPMETDKSILKMLQYNEIPPDASDALKKYYNAFFTEMGNNPNDPVKKRFIKTVYQIIDKS